MSIKTNTSRTKYPRTFHLPWSQGATFDDKTLSSVEHFKGQQVVVTEKLDGENTTLYSGGYVHARSVDSKSHPSQSWVRALAASLAREIPEGWRVCGENVYARHSISYDRLETYLYVFSVWDETGRCLSWGETEEWADLLGLQIVPVLYKGEWDEARIRLLHTGSSQVGDEAEGYVVRVEDSFRYVNFKRSVAKFVRADHVQAGSRHWSFEAVVPNRLL